LPVANEQLIKNICKLQM